jgi:hypothetical protein
VLPVDHHLSAGLAAAADQADQRFEEGRREGGDQRREGGADDDRDRQVDDVAAQQEVLETLDHEVIHPHRRPEDQRRPARPGAAG